MNFILTGHRGLIGTALYKRLIKDGHQSMGVVDVRDTCAVDIRNLGLCNPLGKVDVLFHLASFCKINKCIESPILAFEHNVRGTHEVMEFCHKHNIPKVVFTSSTRVLYPEKNVYTASKVYGEEIVKSYGMEWVIVRPSTVYGPFNDLTCRVTHQFITAAFQGKDLIIYGDTHKTLDFTYVDDFVDAFMQASIETNQEFNVGTGTGLILADVAQLIIDLVGSTSKVIFKDAEKLQPQHVQIDATDFSCNTSIEEGMAKTVEFYRRLYA